MTNQEGGKRCFKFKKKPNMFSFYMVFLGSDKTKKKKINKNKIK